MEPKEEEQYEQDDARRPASRRARCSSARAPSSCPSRRCRALSRQDTIAHFEAAVSAPDGPQYVSAPIEPGMDRTLSTSSTTATAALSGGSSATQLSRVDTFGKMEDASRAAAERGRGGGHGGSALRPRAAAVDGGGADDAVPLPLAHSDTLRALPAVAAALSAVDDADGPAAMGAKPIARTDTMELLQSVDDVDGGAAGGGACGGGGGAEGRRAAGQDCARLLASLSLSVEVCAVVVPVVPSKCVKAPEKSLIIPVLTTSARS